MSYKYISHTPKFEMGNVKLPKNIITRTIITKVSNITYNRKKKL